MTDNVELEPELSEETLRNLDKIREEPEKLLEELKSSKRKVKYTERKLDHAERKMVRPERDQKVYWSSIF